jgi:hypothetical protein
LIKINISQKNKGPSVNSSSLIKFNLPFVLVLNDKTGKGTNSISKEDIINRLELRIMTRNTGNCIYYEDNKASSLDSIIGNFVDCSIINICASSLQS